MVKRMNVTLSLKICFVDEIVLFGQCWARLGTWIDVFLRAFVLLGGWMHAFLSGWLSPVVHG